jgi:DNA-binding response OmpR family regulator
MRAVYFLVWVSSLRKFKVYRVLLVEDDEQFAKFVLAALSRFNFFLRYAGDGRFALKFLKEEPFDLMLCDIAMPHVDGFKLLEKAPSQGLKMPPVLMLTGLKDRENVIKAIAHGAVGYITKPSTLENLMARIKETLKLTDDMLVDKTTMPFSASCNKGDIGEWHIFLSGCPIKDPLKEIKQAIVEATPRGARAHNVTIHVAAEFACEGRADIFLDDLAKYLNKQFLVPWTSTRFTGDFFGAIPLLQKEKFKHDHVVLEP